MKYRRTDEFRPPKEGELYETVESNRFEYYTAVKTCLRPGVLEPRFIMAPVEEPRHEFGPMPDGSNGDTLPMFAIPADPSGTGFSRDKFDKDERLYELGKELDALKVERDSYARRLSDSCRDCGNWHAAATKATEEARAAEARVKELEVRVNSAAEFSAASVVRQSRLIDALLEANKWPVAVEARKDPAT